MSKKYEYKGHTYWITVDNGVNTETQEGGFLAYVSDYEPSAYQWGILVRDGNGRVMLFPNELSALTNANAIKQSEIDSSNNG